MFHNRFLVGLMLGLLACGGSPPAVAQQPLQYLGFQVSIGEGDPRSPLGNSQGLWTRAAAASGAIGSIPLNRPPRRELLAGVARNLVAKIGNTGQGNRRLSLIFGPLAFDQVDEDITRVVDDAFAIATENNVAVGFHIDDSKFWSRRSDLWRNPENVEWLRHHDLYGTAPPPDGWVAVAPDNRVSVTLVRADHHSRPMPHRPRPGGRSAS